MMNRKLSTALILALVLALATSVAVFAQDSGPVGSGYQAMQQGQEAAPRDGTGYRHGLDGDDQGMARQGTGTPNGSGINFVDEDGDGLCDQFVDEDGDGLCDNCDQLGAGQMGRRGGRNQDGTGDGPMRRGGGRQGGQGRNR